MLNFERKDEPLYYQDVVQISTESKPKDGWDMAFVECGNSIGDGKDYEILTHSLHGDEVPEELQDAKTTAELIVDLLNLYYSGRLRQVPFKDPNQEYLFAEEHER
jgi:hypothetical protein